MGHSRTGNQDENSKACRRWTRVWTRPYPANLALPLRDGTASYLRFLNCENRRPVPAQGCGRPGSRLHHVQAVEELLSPATSDAQRTATPVQPCLRPRPFTRQPAYDRRSQTSISPDPSPQFRATLPTSAPALRVHASAGIAPVVGESAVDVGGEHAAHEDQQHEADQNQNVKHCSFRIWILPAKCFSQIRLPELQPPALRRFDTVSPSDRRPAPVGWDEAPRRAAPQSGPD